jgi:hypothetical protein
MPSALRALVVSMVVLVTAMRPVLAAPNETERERQARAVAIFERGEAQFVDGRYDAAATLFREAYETFEDPAYLLNIGLAFEKGERWPLAVLWYDRFLQRYPKAPQVPEAQRRRAAAAKSRDAARAIVMVVSTPAGALASDLTARDGEGEPARCVTPCRLAVDPGPVVIQVALGDLRAERTKSLSPGERWDLEVTLSASSIPTMPVAGPDRTAAWVALGVGGAALVTGIVFAVLAKGSYDDARALTGRPLDADDFARFGRERDAAKTQSLVADLGFLGALTGATIGTVLWLDAPDEIGTTHVMDPAPLGPRMPAARAPWP